MLYVNDIKLIHFLCALALSHDCFQVSIFFMTKQFKCIRFWAYIEQTKTFIKIYDSCENVKMRYRNFCFQC